GCPHATRPAHLSLHDALPIYPRGAEQEDAGVPAVAARREHRFGLLQRRFFNEAVDREAVFAQGRAGGDIAEARFGAVGGDAEGEDRKSTRLNSSHVKNSYAVF